MKIDYIIIQAGGKGSRLEYLTENKPKCLVPIGNRPMLFHLFDKYSDTKFIVIGDYKFEVLDKYLSTFATVDYELVNAGGHKGTCAGISEAVSKIPKDKSFLLIWSDLVLTDDYQFPKEDGNYVGLSGDFKCRWKYENGEFNEEASVTHGVAGHFIFKSKSVLNEVPKDGEFVKWLKEENIDFKTQIISRTKEYGLLSEYRKLAKEKCRPFNRMWVEDGKLHKEGIDEQGRKLSVMECEWYSKAKELGYKRMPIIYSLNPIVMEYIKGKNIYEYNNSSIEEKKEIIEKVVKNLKELHGLADAKVDLESVRENYVDKTWERISKVESLIPYSDRDYIWINGRKCHNVFRFLDEFKKIEESVETRKFQFIHGDCTFSNMMLRENGEPVLIDPRGYFGHTKLYGDPVYDWAKVYYSIVGNYDQFNLKRFQLHFEDDRVNIQIESNGFEDTEKLFLELIKDDASEQQLKIIHALIWLSLTTYAWEDYDSICAAFYIGLYYLEEVWK